MENLTELEEIIRCEIPKITPSQPIIAIIKSLVKETTLVILEAAKKNNFPIKDIIHVGSSSRDTFLPDRLEIDLFVRVPYHSRESLKRFVHEVFPIIAKRMDSIPIIKYAEHPYGTIEVLRDGHRILIDIVPTIYIDSLNDLPSVLPFGGMARTPFHTQYLKSKVCGIEKEIRLLKYWLKRKRLYGQLAFTGYIAELLTIEYQSFINVLKNAQNISRLRSDHLKRSNNELESQFRGSLIIIVDPTDPTRNAAAGIHGLVGELNLNRFVREAHLGLLSPTSMFNKIKLPERYIRIDIVFSIQDASSDIVFSRLASVGSRLFKQGRIEHFESEDLLILPEKQTLVLTAKYYRLETITITGPPLKLIEHCKKFLVIHPDSQQKNGRLYAVIQPRYSSFEELSKKILSQMDGIANFTVELIAG